MQTPAELVPVRNGPQCGVKAPKLRESSGKLLHFGKIPKKFGQNLAKIQQHSGKFCEIVYKNQQNFSNFNENFEVREKFYEKK